MDSQESYRVDYFGWIRLNNRKTRNMFCYVILGESHDKHTRKYLYKCDELTPGDTVLVPAKNRQKVALVYSLLKNIPEGLGLQDIRIKKVFSSNINTIESKEISSYILALIDDYKDGNIDKDYFYYVVKNFINANKLNISENSELQSVIRSIMSDIFPLFIHEYEDELERELCFWKTLKDVEYRLRYGYSYKERDERFTRRKTDPIELTDEYLKIELELDRCIRMEIGEGGYRGYCHRYWGTKKKILKEKYGIEWKSPADMNPGIIFD